MENSHIVPIHKNQIKNGTPKDQILAFLVSKGWPLEIIESTFDSINNEETKVSEPVNISQIPILKPKKSLKKRIIAYLIIALTILLIIGGGLFAYLNYFPSPEIVLARTFQNMSKVTSFEYSADFSVKGKVSDVNGFSYDGTSNLILEGGFDKKDINNQKSLLNLIVKTTPQGQSAMEVKLESRLKNKDLYAAITKGPEVIDTIKNQWVKFSLDEKDTEIQNLENNLKIATNEKKVSPEQQKKLDAQLMKIAKISKVYADDKIDQMDMFHYQYEISPIEVANYYMLIRETNEEKSLTNEEKENVKKELKDVQPVIGEIWIGKKDFNLYRIKSYYDFSKNLDNYWTAGVDVKIKNYDQAIQFDIPDKAKTPEEIYDMYNLSGQTTLLKELEEAKNLEVDTDKDGLGDIEEKYKYGTNPNNPDTDGDSYLDGDEVKNEYNPNGEGRLIEGICGFSKCPEVYNVN